MPLPMLFTGLGLCWPWLVGCLRQHADLRVIVIAAAIWVHQAALSG